MRGCVWLGMVLGIGLWTGSCLADGVAIEPLILEDGEGIVYGPGDTKGKWRPYIVADYLFYRPTRRGLDFAILDPAVDLVVSGPYTAVELESSSGVRVGLGSYLPCPGWDFVVFYTYFDSSGSRTAVSGWDGSLLATTTRPGPVAEAYVARARANLSYDVWDAEIGRELQLAENWSLRLALGAKFAIIDHQFDVLYDGFDAANARVSNPISFDGAGPRLGADSAWTLWRGFGIRGKGYGSLLAGEFRTQVIETNFSGFQPVTNITEKYQAMVPVAELGLGMFFRTEHLWVEVGYEVVHWFNFIDVPMIVNEMNYGTTARRQGDFSLDGLYARFGLSF